MASGVQENSPANENESEDNSECESNNFYHFMKFDICMKC